MGKIRSGVRVWGHGVLESVRRWMRATLKPRFSRPVTGTHSFMATELTERQSEGLVSIAILGLFACALAARWGILPQFLVGLAVGGGVMAAWEQAMERRSRQRESIAAKVALHFEHSLKANSGFARVEWLNRLWKKAWPYVVLATEDARPSIRDFLEPLLEEYRLGVYQVIREQPEVQRIEKYFPIEDRIITCLHINEISLGTTTPAILGLKIHQLKEEKVICNVRMEWQSDAHVTLGVGTVAGIVPVILENLKILATVRVILRITESPPFVAAVVATIPAESKPTFDFTLTETDSSTTLLKAEKKQLRNLVTNFIFDTLLWPHRLVLPIISPGKDIDLSDLYLRLHGQLSVAIIKGENLVNLYPYVIIYCRPRFKVRTKSIENTHDPTWNEEFTLNVEDQTTQSVMFQVMNENKGDDQLLGSVAYPLKKLALDQDVQLQLDVQPRKKKHGGVEEGADGVEVGKKTNRSLIIELRYHVYTDLERETAIKGEEELLMALGTPDEPNSYTTAIDLIHP